MSSSVSQSGAAASTKREQREAYLGQLLASVGGLVPTDLAPDLRRTAEALVKEQTFPHGKQETWRFTDLSPMLSIPFTAVDKPVAIDAAAIEPVLLPEATVRLVTVNGRFNAALSDVNDLPAGVVAGSLQELWSDAAIRSQLESRLAQQPGGHEVFTALNTAGFQDAMVLWIPRNCAVEAPVQLINVAIPQPSPKVVQPRALVVAETGSAVTFVEEFWGRGIGDHFTNGVSEVWVEDNAQVVHVRSQRETQSTFHIGKTVVSQGRDSHYRCITVALGSRLARHHLEVYQQGAQTTTHLYGLGAIQDAQVSDTQTIVALQHPHGTVDQLQKNIIDDRAHSVFSGRIIVPHDAQLTNASQLNRNLLLSDKGRVDTKPQLEIVADNVQCAHGATVSQLENNELFYLQSRGISAEQAQRLLIYAFAMEILNQIPLTTLRQQLTETISQLVDTD